VEALRRGSRVTLSGPQSACYWLRLSGRFIFVDDTKSISEHICNAIRGTKTCVFCMIIVYEIQSSLVCGDCSALVPSERKCVALLVLIVAESNFEPPRLLRKPVGVSQVISAWPLNCR